MNTSSSFCDSATIGSESSTNTNLNRLNGHKNKQTLNSKPIEKRISQIIVSDRICNQFQLTEKLIWDFNEFTNKKNKDEDSNEIVFKILM